MLEALRAPLKLPFPDRRCQNQRPAHDVTLDQSIQSGRGARPCDTAATGPSGHGANAGTDGGVSVAKSDTGRDRTRKGGPPPGLPDVSRPRSLWRSVVVLMPFRARSDIRIEKIESLTAGARRRL